MTKRILSAILAALMLFALCVPALAAEDGVTVTWFSMFFEEDTLISGMSYDEYLDIYLVVVSIMR